MDPVTAGAISAGGAAGGSIIGTVLQNQANARQQDRSQDWMAWMSNTSHQREVADLRAAGLNPILSANKGASTPQISPARMENVLGAGVSSALDSLKLSTEIRGANSQIGLNEANATAAKAQALQAATTAKQNETNTKILEAELPARAAESRTRQGQAKWNQRMMDFDNTVNRLQQGLDIGGSAMRMIRPSLPVQPGNLNPHKEKWTSQQERNEMSRQDQFRKAEELFKK